MINSLIDSKMAPKSYSMTFKLAGAGPVSSVAWPSGVPLVFHFSVMLLDFPEISSCQATRVICAVLLVN